MPGNNGTSNGTNGHGSSKNPHLADTLRDPFGSAPSDEDSDPLITLTSGPNTEKGSTGRGGGAQLFVPPPRVVAARPVPTPATATIKTPSGLRAVTAPSPAPTSVPSGFVSVEKWVDENSSASIPVEAMAAMAQPVTVRVPTITPPPIPMGPMPQPPAVRRDTTLGAAVALINHERLAEYLLHPDNGDLLVKLFQTGIRAAAEEVSGNMETLKRGTLTEMRRLFTDKIVELEQANQDLVSATEQLAQGELRGKDLLAKLQQMQGHVDRLTAQAGEANVAQRAAGAALVSYQDLVQVLLAKIDAGDQNVVALKGKLQIIAASVDETDTHAAAALKAARQARSERPYKTGIKPLHAVIGGGILAIIMVLSGALIAKSGNSSSAAPVAQMAAKAPMPLAAPTAPVAKAVEAPAPTPVPTQKAAPVQVAPSQTTVAPKKEMPTPPSDICWNIHTEVAAPPTPGADGRWAFPHSGRNWSCDNLRMWNKSKQTGLLCGCR